MGPSEFIKNLLDCPSDQALEHSPIALENDAEIIRHFIDLINSRGTLTMDLDVAGFSQLFALCDRFESTAIADSISRAMCDKLRRHPYPGMFDPWEVFKLAARLDRFELARTAAANMSRGGRQADRLVVKTQPSHFDNVPPRYIYALIRAVLVQRRYYNQTEKRWCSHAHWEPADPDEIDQAFTLE